MYRYLLLPCILLSLQHFSIPTVSGIHVMYDYFNQINGTDLVDCRSLRIRKINRTATAMNGTINFKVPLDNNYKIGFTTYYSRLGNNQFVKHPMKIAPMGVCDFTREFYNLYYPLLKKGVVNYPPTTKCPLSPKVVYVSDYMIPREFIPPFIPKGLWRVILTLKYGDEIVGVTETLSKLYSDLEW